MTLFASLAKKPVTAGNTVSNIFDIGNVSVQVSQLMTHSNSAVVMFHLVFPAPCVPGKDLCTGQTLESVIAENYPGLARLQGEHIFLSANSYLFPPIP